MHGAFEKKVIYYDYSSSSKRSTSFRLKISNIHFIMLSGYQKLPMQRRKSQQSSKQEVGQSHKLCFETTRVSFVPGNLSLPRCFILHLSNFYPSCHVSFWRLFAWTITIVCYGGRGASYFCWTLTLWWHNNHPHCWQYDDDLTELSAGTAINYIKSNGHHRQ